MKNNDGFTIVELLVCIAILSMLAIAVGISTNRITQRTVSKQNVATFEELFNAAETYAVTKFREISSGTMNKVTIGTLVSQGYIDKEILEKKNPLLQSGLNFNGEDYFSLTVQSGEIKYVFYTKSNTSCSLTFNDVTIDYNWEVC